MNACLCISSSFLTHSPRHAPPPHTHTLTALLLPSQLTIQILCKGNARIDDKKVLE